MKETINKFRKFELSNRCKPFSLEAGHPLTRIVSVKLDPCMSSMKGISFDHELKKKELENVSIAELIVILGDYFPYNKKNNSFNVRNSLAEYCTGKINGHTPDLLKIIKQIDKLLSGDTKITELDGAWYRK